MGGPVDVGTGLLLNPRVREEEMCGNYTEGWAKYS